MTLRINGDAKLICIDYDQHQALEEADKIPRQCFIFCFKWRKHNNRGAWKDIR